MRFALLLLASLSCWVLAASGARAQLFTAREHERMLDSGRFALTSDVNMFFGRAAPTGRAEQAPRAPAGDADPDPSAGYTFLQPTLVGSARWREAVFEAALPFAYFHENNQPGADADRFALGNLWFALAYLPDCDCGLSRLSLGMAVDTARSSSPLLRKAHALARGAMGDWDGYLWIDHMLPLVAGASTRMELGKKLRLSWDGDIIMGLPAGSRGFELGTQHAGELAVVFSWHWQLAGRLSAAYYPTLDGDDFQSAASLYLRYVSPHYALGARFVMNLDRPHGFAFDRDGMWGLGLFYSTAL